MADPPRGDRPPGPAPGGDAEDDAATGETGGSTPGVEAESDPDPESGPDADPRPDSESSPDPESGSGLRSDPDEASLVALAGPLSTFHVTALVVVALLAVHASGRVGAALGGLDTATGIAAYLLLWGLTYATVRGWLAGIDAAEVGPVGVLLRAAGWGAATGVSFLWIALAAVLVARVPLAEVGSVSLQFVGLFLAVGFGIGGGIAALVGGAVGVAFGAVDYALLGVATRVVARRDPTG